MNMPIPGTNGDQNGLSDLQESLEIIDAHTHESGSGVPITQNGLNITGDFSLNQKRLTQAKDVSFVNNLSAQTGSNSAYVVDGDLFFRNNDGIAVQITEGGSIITGSAAVSNLVVDERTSDVVIQAGTSVSAFVFTDTSARSVTLPDASSVNNGTFFWIKDGTSLTGSTRISIYPAGSDTINGSGSSQPQQVYDNALVFRGETATWWMQRSPFKAVNDVSASIVASLATASSSINASFVSSSNALSFTSASLRQTISNLSSSITSSFASFASSITSSFTSASNSITVTSQSINNSFNRTNQTVSNLSASVTASFASFASSITSSFASASTDINNLRTPQFLALASSTELPNERTFTPGTGLKATDAGAGSTYTLNVNDTVVATVSGSRFTGPVVAAAGLTGSMFTTPAGISYIAQGTGITVASASNGQITISSTVSADVTAAGNNTFTGTNTFSKDVFFAQTVHSSGTLRQAGTTVFSKDVFVAQTAHFSGSVNVQTAYLYLTTTFYNTAQTGSHTFDTRWRYAEITLIGGGGGSGGVDGVSTSDAGASGGGGGGAVHIIGFTRGTLTTGSSFLVGSGGAGGAAGANDGKNGARSGFWVGSTLFTANPGNGGEGVTANSNGVRCDGGSGGAAASTTINTIVTLDGGDGRDGVAFIKVPNNIMMPGSGGACGFGGNTTEGAISVDAEAGGASAGGFPGGGASGCRSGTATDVAGAAGSVGLVMVKEYM
jgi:hypothetical protein